MRLALERIAERGGIVEPTDIRVEYSTLNSLLRRGLVALEHFPDRPDWYVITDAGRRVSVGLK